MPASPPVEDAVGLYLDLLKRALLAEIHESSAELVTARGKRLIGTEAMKRLAQERVELVQVSRGEDRQVFVEGRRWPFVGETMIGRARMDSLHEQVERVIADDVPGDLIETGVWRGGATILMRGVLRAHGVTDRRVWVADSFQGLPEPNAEKYPADAGNRCYTQDRLSIPLEVVRGNFARYGLLDDQVVFLPGWFRDTLPTIRDERWAIVRLDGDLYESTIDALENLYPQLSFGGYLVIDDYALPMAERAVEDFRRANGITEPMRRIDWTGAYWRRER